MMMQLDPQSRWQSWMRMLALDIRPVHEPGPSTAGGTRLGFPMYLMALIEMNQLDGAAQELIRQLRDENERREALSGLKTFPCTLWPPEICDWKPSAVP
jgi:hypothetical protein